MSRRDKGIAVRHQRRCEGEPCTCKPTFQAEAYDRRTGRRLRRTFKTVTAARQWRTDAQSALRKGQITAHAGPTLKQAVDEWVAGARAGHIKNRSGDPYKPAAVRGYEKDLRLRVLPTLGSLRLREIQAPDLQRLIDRLVAENVSASTVQGAITPLRAIYRRAIVRGVVTENPTRGLELPAIRSRPRRYLNPSEADQLVQSLTGAARALWATALYAGLRRGELTGLRRDDVDLAAGVIRVRRGWDAVEGEIEPKSRKGKRSVPIPAILRDELLEHLMTHTGARMFGTPHEIRKHAAAAEIDLHDARHSYASLMIAAGVNPKALSTFMGHANIQVTFDLYGHLMPGAEDESAGLLDAYLARAAGGTVSEPTDANTAAQEPSGHV